MCRRTVSAALRIGSNRLCVAQKYQRFQNFLPDARMIGSGMSIDLLYRWSRFKITREQQEAPSDCHKDRFGLSWCVDRSDLPSRARFIVPQGLLEKWGRRQAVPHD